jgi:alpha-beta hydrolase superfamily lysophospholipase
MFTFDLRGHGKSEGLRGHFLSADLILKDIDLLLERARIRFPGIPLILYGHSLGGILVLYYSLKRNPDVKGVLATSPGLHTALEKQPLKILAARILGTIAPTFTMPSGLDDNGLSHDKAVILQYRQDPLVHDRLSVGFGKVMLGVIDWTLSHAGEFSLPLLLIHGKADSIAYPESSSEFAAQVNQNCHLVLWEDGFHELHNEPFKEEVFNTMISWANSLLTQQIN